MPEGEHGSGRVVVGRPKDDQSTIDDRVGVGRPELDATGEFGSGTSILRRPREHGTLPGRTVVQSVAYSPDGALLATTTADGRARLWDASTGRRVLTLAGHDAGFDASCVHRSPERDEMCTPSTISRTPSTRAIARAIRA